MGEGDGFWGDVDTLDGEIGDVWLEAGEELEGDAACSGAEVDDVEGVGFGGLGEDEGGDFEGVSFRFGSRVVSMNRTTRGFE